jgi:hypothetical protein
MDYINANIESKVLYNGLYNCKYLARMQLVLHAGVVVL